MGIHEMGLGDLAAFICGHLLRNGIKVVLSGGACVSIFSENRYQSYDLDFVESMYIARKRLRAVMAEIGFVEHQHRYFRHLESDYYVEFPPGPVTVGDELVRAPQELIFATGTLVLLSPTDSVKDRLAGYYHWKDKQCLEQAVLITRCNNVDMEDIRRWSEREGKYEEFLKIRPQLEKRNRCS